MSFRLFTVALFVSLTLIECSTKDYNNASDKNLSAQSRVEKFEYSGYSDTIFALIDGKVYEPVKNSNGIDTLLPLSQADVKVSENGAKTVTDENGEFGIWLGKGTFTLEIKKEGYEPITLTNYVSDPDQISFAKIILVKGKKQRTFEIPKWTR